MLLKNLIRAIRGFRQVGFELAGIQYIGVHGVTSSCIKAVACLLSSGIRFKSASLLSCGASHGFLLVDGVGDVIAVKAGFGSGYSGEGARGLAVLLALLHHHKVDIEEYEVDELFMRRLENSCLLRSDVDVIRQGRPIRPCRWYDYIFNQGGEVIESAGRLKRCYPLAVPFGLIDNRIIDLALFFSDNTDFFINTAYRRLEDAIRKRTGLQGEGVKLFSKAFIVDDSPLKWDVHDDGEQKGRANLFGAVYMSFRNARAHREVSYSFESDLREFMLVNELFRLESEALSKEELVEKRENEALLDKSPIVMKRDF